MNFPFKNILVICCSLLIIGCSKESGSSSSTTKAAPTNTAPIYLVDISTSLKASGYDTKFKEGIDAGIAYFGSITGVYIYIYDKNAVEAIAKDSCEKRAKYTTNDYDQCYSNELSASNEYGIKSTVDASNSSNNFNAAVNGSENSFYPMSFGLSDSPTSTATYLAQFAIHEYAHVYQHHHSVAVELPYSKWIVEGYAQLIAQIIGSQKSYLTFSTEMEYSFSSIRSSGDSSLFTATPYDTGSWALAYLMNKINTANSCTSNCVDGLEALKTFLKTAGKSGDSAASFESTFGMSQTAFETEVNSFLLGIDFTGSSTTAAGTWATTFYNSLPASL
ncbi:MAG: hypothetical protein ISR93_00945 [SAR324 cluster bacterium]|nr:hypothetical protein [SAR324 cluster bacterium]